MLWAPSIFIPYIDNGPADENTFNRPARQSFPTSASATHPNANADALHIGYGADSRGTR
ncbi:hypothetical protein GCM10009304_02500 [Pseudomonas matsuisoli]|uniref:Uncharacterized protein n=1 Tax=Pseudomonas matsuisoli TaxID=1515666 RepID=A0A917URG9_9PSED|nr:hypothetical protein GCM10009304_02500 [Pseudomonas matsuisoli]